MWDAWFVMFPLGVVTGLCGAYSLRGCLDARKRAKASLERLKTDLIRTEQGKR